MARTNRISAQPKKFGASRIRLIAILSFLAFANGWEARGADMDETSINGQLDIYGYPDDLTKGVKSDDFAEFARKDWDAMSKALDKGSKEDFEKAVAEFKKLSEAADGRVQLREGELNKYGEEHADALQRKRDGKITSDDVDVLNHYRELQEKVMRAREDSYKLFRLKVITDHSWSEWSELWGYKKAWEKDNPGKSYFAHEKTELKLAVPATPAQPENKKSKSSAKSKTGAKEEAAYDAAAAEAAAGIAAAVLGTQMGERRERSMRDDEKMRSSHRMKETNMGSSKTKTTAAGKTVKSGATRSGGSGTTMNTTVGAPVISFGRGVGF